MKFSEYLKEALTDKDKAVVHAFYDKKSLDGKLLTTDGKVLTKMGMGGQDLYKWEGREITFIGVDDVKSTESVIKYVKKYFPKNIIKEDIINESKDRYIEDQIKSITPTDEYGLKVQLSSNKGKTKTLTINKDNVDSFCDALKKGL